MQAGLRVWLNNSRHTVIVVCRLDLVYGSISIAIPSLMFQSWTSCMVTSNIHNAIDVCKLDLVYVFNSSHTIIDFCKLDHVYGSTVVISSLMSASWTMCMVLQYLYRH